MSGTKTISEQSLQTAVAVNIELKLEVVIIPVSDVDRAKRFYQSLGWRPDADFAFDNGFRVVLGAKVKSAVPVPVPPKPAPIEAPPEVPEHKPEPEPYTSDPEPYRPRAAAGNSCGMVTVFAGVVVGALVLIVVVALLIRRSANRPQTAAPLMRRRGGPRIAEDGFWFETSGYDAGDMVTFTYTGPNGPVTEQFLVEPGHEQFVYTGVRPGDLVMGALIADQLNQEDDPTPPPPRPTARTEEDDRPRRHPPAY
jgi:hypothetical protein